MRGDTREARQRDASACIRRTRCFGPERERDNAACYLVGGGELASEAFGGEGARNGAALGQQASEHWARLRRGELR